MISRSEKVSCPVLNLERYMDLAGINIPHRTSDYLFKPFFKVRSGYKVIEKAKLLSYTRAREFIVGLLSKFVPTTDIISLHSFRAGGQLQRLTLKSPIDAGNDMAGGSQRLLRMATSRIPSTIVYLFPSSWGFDLILLTFLFPFFVFLSSAAVSSPIQQVKSCQHFVFSLSCAADQKKSAARPQKRIFAVPRWTRRRRKKLTKEILT